MLLHKIDERFFLRKAAAEEKKLQSTNRYPLNKYLLHNMHIIYGLKE